ncbi:Caspase-3 [Oopsacas minuta]|uniref:Caspase-3 n=1 Tax=Oopsacas minuta TaxID=111878 RepID=A0AAV7JQ00_9METZ|nr:Caspase-3 [Oopsacas minuta]
MPLNEEQVYKLLLYRKAIYELIDSEEFGNRFITLKKDTQSTLKEKLKIGYTKSFQNCGDELAYFELLEELLLFDETKLQTSVGKIVLFFGEIINNNKRTYGELTSRLDDIQELNNNIDCIILPKISLSNPFENIPKPDVYILDDSVQQRSSDSSQAPRKYYSGEPQQHTLDITDCYHINTTGKRGVCLIVNIYREYASEDVIPLRKVFTSLNYEVKDCDNVSAEDYEIWVGKMKILIDELKSDSLIFIFSSHGDEKNVKFGCGGKRSRDSLILDFQDEYCECLAGRPKLFFFQNCRGQGGISDNTADLEHLMVDTDGLGTKGGASQLSKIPKDILRFYATTDGNAAFRESTGTIFLQTLCQTLDDPEMRRKKFGDFELEFRRRVEELSTKSMGKLNIDGVQVPPSESTLTKHFFFAHPYL